MRLRLVLKLELLYKYDRVYPSRFQSDCYILIALREQIKRLIQKHFADTKDAVLVDYGCGNVPYRPFFEPYVSKYIGVDVPSHFDTGYSAPVDVFTTPEGKLPFEDNFADIVFSIMVLEHVDDPVMYLNECYRVLKPGGRLFVSTLGYWLYHPAPVDYWRWMAPGLRKIIEEAGFKIRELDGIMGLAPVGLQLFQDGIARKLPKFMRHYFIFVMQYLIQFLDRFYSAYTNDRDAAAYTFIAEKPIPVVATVDAGAQMLVEATN
jgi:SAM-dependent methyltransferase